MKPVIFGLSGLTITEGERDFFRDVRPAGYILFGRNIESRDQMRALTDDLRALHGDEDLPILIDQEGGRVARMKPPIWPQFPAGGVFDALYDIAPMTAIEAARVNAEAIALTLEEVGVTVNCLPVLDVRVPETHAAIGDRALGSDPVRVAALGRAILDGLSKGGVVGVVKHMPGQGRAAVDSHYDLPRVTAIAEELEQDIAPFRSLHNAPMGMTGHIMFDAWDSELCSTMSPVIIENVIRGQMGFDGLLMSDDLDMEALSGDVSDRAAGCVAAGCDIALNCWGRMDEMIRIADKLPEISELSLARLNRAMASRSKAAQGERLAGLLDKRDQLIAMAGGNAEAKLTKAATGASHG
ncbi:glycoside hydrolase family 3 N-terminal domain-containing protein [Sphingorhabdus arenilitoris]|uniref:beta-N-acetylhexosaminidase n=1 Tax=Sphingorhabdus arenilitoris TaxID=1490041 RepID=A0ABV8REI3_9SPHN